MNARTYRAPWGWSLIIASALATVILLAAVAIPHFLHRVPNPYCSMLAVLPLVILPGCALFVVRSYTIGVNTLMVQRLLWQTKISLNDLKSAEFVPNVMKWSIRLFGNGGFYSITGLYRNRALGNYRAFVTDTKQTVVLRFATRTIVVSPENPEQFVAEITASNSGGAAFSQSVL